MNQVSLVIAGLMIIFFLGFTAQGQDIKLDLFAAIEKGDQSQVKALLEKGADVNIKSEFGETPLIEAIRSDNIVIIRLLLEKGANLNARDDVGLTPFFAAIKSGSIDITKLLLKKGADVNARDNSGKTPLMLAAERGNLDIAKALLDRGAKINAKNLYGYTAISYSRDLKMVNFLKKHGALNAPKKPKPKKKMKKGKKAYGGSGGGAEPEIAIPLFPWPPPKPSAFAKIRPELLRKEGSQIKVGDVADHLENAFNQAGYGETTWYAVPGGFALASRLEQFNPDGTPKEEPERWSANIKPPAIFGLKDVMRTLFTAQQGRYRIIVFIVTNQAFSAADKTISAEEAGEWVRKGAFNLPEAIREVNYTPEHFCEALIYEFDQPSRDNPADFKAPSELQGETHLRKAKIWSALGG
jgi:hypothetical protein